MKFKKVKDFALKSHWYDQIAQGKKTVEYRDARNPYYVQTLLNVDAYFGKTVKEIMDGLLDGSIKEIKPAGITHIRFHNTGRSMMVEVKGIRIDRANKVFAIDLGKIVTGSQSARTD